MRQFVFSTSSVIVALSTPTIARISSVITEAACVIGTSGNRE
jgi:hypothetical protein